MKRNVPIMALVVSIISSYVCLLVLACTQQQAQNAVNGVFSVDEVACIIANAGLAGNSTAVQDFEVACNIAPSLEPEILALITELSNPATMAKLKAHK